MRISQSHSCHQSYSFGAPMRQQPQPVIKINQPCFRVYPQPMQKKKSQFQKGYDLQEENKTLKQYVSQMEQQLQSLGQIAKQDNTKRSALISQLKQNSLLRDDIQRLKTEITTELAELAYLERVCLKL